VQYQYQKNTDYIEANNKSNVEIGILNWKIRDRENPRYVKTISPAKSQLAIAMQSN